MDARETLDPSGSRRAAPSSELEERSTLATFAGDVCTALVTHASMQDGLRACAELLVRHLGAAFARVWTLGEAGEVLELQASAGLYTQLDGTHARVPLGRFKIGRIALEQEPHLTNDVLRDRWIADAAWAQREGMVAFAGYPLLVEGRLVGVMALFARQALTGLALQAMATVAGAIAQYVERKRTEEALRRSEEARRAAEEAQRHAQKLEALGQLAGGIAHDFNNLLTVIIGYTESAMSILPPDSPCLSHLDEVARAGNRAAGLTRQILAFARRQLLRPVAFDLNILVANFERILNCLVGETILLRTRYAAASCRIIADTTQVEQVLLNLVANARDAMPNGGDLRITIAAATLDEAYARQHAEVRPGPYVLLEVSDTGTGISPETLGKIFEPFFTTKEPGRGTGLGLSTVYGIVKQSGGHLEVASTMGRGTTIRVYLPVAPGGDGERPM